MRRLIFAVAVIIFFAVCEGAQANGFVCSFMQENSPEGKSNAASCAMSPEAVYALRDYIPKRWQHCDVERVYLMREYHEARIDLDAKTVQWELVMRLANHAKEKLKKQYISEGNTLEQVDRKIQDFPKRTENFKIYGDVLTGRIIRYDPIIRKSIDPPRSMAQHSITFGDGVSTYVLSITEGVSEAILAEFTGDSEHSWVNIKFGRCRKDS